MDNYSRDYDVKRITAKDDPRLAVCSREAIFIMLLYIFIIIAAFATAAFLSDLKLDSYPFGFPLWVITGIVIILAGAWGGVIYIVKSQKFTFSAKASEDENNEKL